MGKYIQSFMGWKIYRSVLGYYARRGNDWLINSGLHFSDIGLLKLIITQRK